MNLPALPFDGLGPAAGSSSSRLQRALSGAQRTDRCALILSTVVGFPDRLTCRSVLHLLAQSADIVQLRIPHLDMVRDGLAVRQAARTALQAGFRTPDVFAAARELATGTRAAVLISSHWQPVHVYGAARFAQHAANAGVDAVHIRDLPLDQAGPWRAIARTTGLGTIPLLSPTVAPDRLARIVGHATGLIYAPATTGLTGNTEPIGNHLTSLVSQVRALTSLPVAAAVGLSAPDQVRTAAAWVDAVAVGSAVVRRIQSEPQAPLAAAAAVARTFAAALRPKAS
ncbi:tryptophan synthase subunit alpha [Streptomyces tauricus]|uniref:tryptophan synthase subunit alpha n=1 Tax=Streptomyces tauricus TaxID=68274 RepID=UPI002244D2D6|nr:tryptophan synthase subunit alpha [Streptomyces tauricus]MCW8101721.1 tryptophan synthase subunit alpha [Streptomyces tauricus]